MASKIMSVILSINTVVTNVCLSNETCKECYYGRISPSVKCGVVDDYNDLFQRLDTLRTRYCFPAKCKECVYGYSYRDTSFCLRFAWFEGNRSRRLKSI